MKAGNEVAVIPSRFTGGQPLVVSRSSIREIYDGRGEEVRIIMSDGQETLLKVGSQVTKAEMDELYGILFGPNVLRFKALARELGGWKKLNPAAVCSVEFLDPEPEPEEGDRQSSRGRRRHSLLVVQILNSTKLEISHVDFESFQRIVAALYGSEVATRIVPRTAPTLTQEAMAKIGAFFSSKRQRDEQSAEAAARRKAADLERAKTKRFGPAFR